MSKYKCIKSFSIPEIDFNNFETGELFEVKAGETYEIYSDNYIGGDVHLENEDHWIEITFKEFQDYFEEMEVRNE